MSTQLPSAYAYCDVTLRAQARDTWLACLFAPAHRRPHLHALYHFADEMAHLREKIAQPMAGEIRLQYWRDVVSGRGHGETLSNPLAAALLDTIDSCKLPRQPLLGLLDARLFDVYDDPMPDITTLEGYCGETESAVIRLACLVLADGVDPGGADAAGHAGVALGITRVLADLPRTAARGQVHLPGDVLQKAGLSAADVLARHDSPQLRAVLAEMRGLVRSHVARARAGMGLNAALIAPAFAGLAVAGLYLRRMEKHGYQPFAAVPEVPQWRRQWAMWRGM